MNIKRYLIILILILSSFYYPANCQETVEKKLDRIEAKIDTLIAVQRGQIENLQSYEIIKDTLNILWGIGSIRGTILDKRYFVINHNDDWKIPYWVAYYLSFSNLQGETPRTDDFRTDPNLPIGSRAELKDYRKSGYDRGHNAPAAAFKRSRAAMSTTFLLSNMSPQTPRLNRGKWKILEEQVRNIVMEEGEAWVITGNLFLNSDSQFVSPSEFIGPDSVAVPSHCFKAILTTDENGVFSMFAFLLPNQIDYIPGRPRDYQIKVDRLEKITGYDFFHVLEDNIENRLENIIITTWPK